VDASQLERAWSRLARPARPYVKRAHRTLLRHPARVACPVCGWSGVRFRASRKPRRPNRLCPQCGSTERYRALELHLAERGRVPAGTRLLEIAPVGTVRPTVERLGYEYHSLDLKSAVALVHGDLCALPFADASFDVVVCFHVLEHVPADLVAVEELARIVGTEGEVIVVVPRDRALDATFEDPNADPADYERLYGQSDHVRMYGEDVTRRWSVTGVSIDEVPWDRCFGDDVHRRAALTGDDDRFWILRAPAERSVSV
jgi:SAM-dependent methyltransferase